MWKMKMFIKVAVYPILMKVAGVTKTSAKMSFTFVVLAVIFIIRLFTTSAVRVPNMKTFTVKNT